MEWRNLSYSVPEKKKGQGTVQKPILKARAWNTTYLEHGWQTTFPEKWFLLLARNLDARSSDEHRYFRLRPARAGRGGPWSAVLGRADAVGKQRFLRSGFCCLLGWKRAYVLSTLDETPTSPAASAVQLAAPRTCAASRSPGRSR